MADAAIRVAITSDTSDLNKGLAESQGKLAGFGKAVGKAALVAGGALAAGLGALAKVSVAAASDAQQSLGATETVFGKFADTVTRTSKQAADSVGLSANAYRNNANILGALLANQGVAQDKLAGKTKSLIGTAADLAATFGGPTSDAVEALASAFKGEFDPLERYGISIKQSAINTEAYRVAGVKTKKAFDELSTAQQNAAKQQATTNLLTKQSAKVQGAFASESETLAHQQQVMAAHWDDLKVKIGDALLPAITNLAGAVNKKLFPMLNDLADKYLPKVSDALDEWTAGFDPGEMIGKLSDKLKEIDWDKLSTDTKGIGDSFSAMGDSLKGVSSSSFNDTLKVTGTVMKFLADHLDLVAKALPYVVAGFLALKSAQLANQTVGKDSLVGFAAQLYSTRQLTKANKELAASIKTLNGAQAGGGMAGLGGKMADAETKADKFAGAMRGAAGAAGIGLLTAAAETSDQKVGTFADTLGGMATGFAVGGPWGAAIGGAAGLLLGLVTHTKDAGDEAQKSKAKWDGLAGTLDEVSGATTEATRAFIYDELQRKGVIKILAQQGISGRTAVDAIIGEKEARNELNAVIKTTTASYQEDLATLNQLKDARDAAALVGDTNRVSQLNQQVAAQQKVVDQEKKELDAVNQATGAVREQTKAMRNRSKAVTDYHERLKGLPKKAITSVEAHGLPTTTKGIARLAKRYKLTPEQIKTLISVTGVETSVKKVERVKKKLKSIDDPPKLTVFQQGMKNKLHAMAQARETNGAAIKDKLRSETGKAKPNLDPFKASFTRQVGKTKGAASSGGHEIGASLKQGILAGVGGLGSALSQAVSGAVTGAIAAGKKAAGAHSPSRKMYDLGRDMGKGLEIGITSSYSALTKAGAGAAQSASQGAASVAGAQVAITPAGGGNAAATVTAPPPPTQLAPRQTPVTVMLDGHEIADRLELRRSLAAVESVRRMA